MEAVFVGAEMLGEGVLGEGGDRREQLQKDRQQTTISFGLEPPSRGKLHRIPDQRS